VIADSVDLDHGKRITVDTMALPLTAMFERH
jgi:hypothetical protein